MKGRVGSSASAGEIVCDCTAVGCTKAFRARLVCNSGDNESSEKFFIQSFAKEISEPTKDREKVCGTTSM